MPLLIGEATAARVSRPLIELDRIAVKGRADGISVFTAIGDVPAEQAAFLCAYRAGRWDEADIALDTLAAHFELEAYAARIRERVAACRRSPPAENWNGVFAATEK